MRGVTFRTFLLYRLLSFQLTRLMRGVTTAHLLTNGIGFISTHTPHARRDADLIGYTFSSEYFNSHASCEA